MLCTFSPPNKKKKFKIKIPEEGRSPPPLASAFLSPLGPARNRCKILSCGVRVVVRGVKLQMSANRMDTLLYFSIYTPLQQYNHRIIIWLWFWNYVSCKIIYFLFLTVFNKKYKLISSNAYLNCCLWVGKFLMNFLISSLIWRSKKYFIKLYII